MKLTNNSSVSRRNGDWIDIIKIGKYSSIIEDLNKNNIKNSQHILKDIQSIIDEYTGSGDIDVCLIRLGNCNRWSNYSIIFDDNSDLYHEVDIPYENDLLTDIYFDSEKNTWYYQK
jgi:hypothetical protein